MTAEGTLGLVGDAHPLVAGVLAEACDPCLLGSAPVLVRGVLVEGQVGQRPDDEDLVVVDGDLRCPCVPIRQEAAP